MQMLHLKRILVPIDFSDNSMNALETATSIAKRHDASVKLVYVNDNDNKFYPHLHSNGAHDAMRTLGTLARCVKDDGNIECSFSFFSGSITSCILQDIADESIDLIVMGKNGNAGKRELYAGSCAYDVSKKALCPVLLVPAGKSWSQFKNILFPVRPSVSMLEKYTTVKEIINKNDATLHIMNLRNPDYINELHIISKLVDLLKRKFEEDNIKTKISYYFRDDKFAEKILKTVQEATTKHDLLIISAEHNIPANTFYLSPYAQQIIHQANIPVLVIKPETIPQSKEIELELLEKQISAN
ncbi:universal stress protein [Panacibacter ginsenosidivorans]|uniref:Universal stress protein n=1 Tax=Panacibacter ginsenosidivorans TaxID=1813871 RepID=A0A5B8VGQ0_9BACT|nr:universal stress protein [Panacibacter ginsenosidivorans]QEC69746.1 universal stress protein [Panacibacter ginsenosidivorans]